MHIQRKKEEELADGEKVVVDINVGRLDPNSDIKEKVNDASDHWERRTAGIWLKRSAKRHASDNVNAVTAVDVLFGPDAVDPREGWGIVGTALLLDTNNEGQEPRLSVRRGKHTVQTRIVPRIRENGKFKIMQAADLHLSTGIGHCRDAMPADGSQCEADPRTLEFMAKMLDEEKPDLVVLGGDQVNGESAPDAQSVSILSEVCEHG